MNISILRVNKSTAKRAHIILLLPFITAIIKLKIFVCAAILAAIFTAILSASYYICKKHLSIVVAYPIGLILIGMLAVTLSHIPDFWGFSIKDSAIPAIFLSLFFYKYIGAVRDDNKLKNVVIKFSAISAGSFILSSIVEILSFGTIFDFEIHNHPVQFFSTYSGVFFILAIITAIINITAGKKIDINKSFNMKKGSIRLISYSAATALLVSSIGFTIINFILNPHNITYITPVIVCFLCGLSFICFRLLDKKLHIGKHSANLIPSVAMLFCQIIQLESNSLKEIVFSLSITYILFVISVYLCEIIATRKSVTDIRNPFAGAPSALIIFSIAAFVLDSINKYIIL